MTKVLLTVTKSYFVNNLCLFNFLCVFFTSSQADLFEIVDSRRWSDDVALVERRLIDRLAPRGGIVDGESRTVGRLAAQGGAVSGDGRSRLRHQPLDGGAGLDAPAGRLLVGLRAAETLGAAQCGHKAEQRQDGPNGNGKFLSGNQN